MYRYMLWELDTIDPSYVDAWRHLGQFNFTTHVIVRFLMFFFVNSILLFILFPLLFLLSMRFLYTPCTHAHTSLVVII